MLSALKGLISGAVANQKVPLNSYNGGDKDVGPGSTQ